MAALKHQAADVIAVIPGSGGIKTVIAKRLGVTHQTVGNYIKRWQSVRDAYDAECESMTDMARSVLYESIRGGDVGSAKWLLSKKDPEFGDKMDITSGGERIEIVVKYADD